VTAVQVGGDKWVSKWTNFLELSRLTFSGFRELFQLRTSGIGLSGMGISLLSAFLQLFLQDRSNLGREQYANGALHGSLLVSAQAFSQGFFQLDLALD